MRSGISNGWGGPSTLAMLKQNTNETPLVHDRSRFIRVWSPATWSLTKLHSGKEKFTVQGAWKV